MKYGNESDVEPEQGGRDGEGHGALLDDQDQRDRSDRRESGNDLAEQGIGMDFDYVELDVLQRDEKVPYAGSLPANLLLEQRLHIVGDGCPALRIRVDHGSITLKEDLMREEPVFSVVDLDAKPVPRQDLGFKLDHEIAPYREHTAADAGYGPGPGFDGFEEVEANVVDERLAFGEDVFVHVANADNAANSADLGIGKAGNQFLNGVRREDTVAVDGEDDLR